MLGKIVCTSRDYFLPTIPPGHSRDEVLSQNSPLKLLSVSIEMTPDSYMYVSLFSLSSYPGGPLLLLFIAWGGIIIYTTIYLFHILSLVSTFFHLQQLIALICAPLAQEDTFIKQEWSSTITEKPQTTAVSNTGKDTVEYSFFILTRGPCQQTQLPFAYSIFGILVKDSA